MKMDERKDYSLCGAEWLKSILMSLMWTERAL